MITAAVLASIYPIDYIADDHTYTEGNMYATNNGPFAIKGTSSIEASLDVKIKSLMPGLALKDGPPRIVLVFYHAETAAVDSDGAALLTICQNDAWNMTDRDFQQKMASHGMSSPKRLSFQTVNDGTVPITAERAHYTVTERGLQYLRITVCPRDSLVSIKDLNVSINGTLSFKNPYGYLAGELYPLLPFEAVLTAAYFVLDVVFLALIYCYRTEVLRLQFSMLAVLVLATGETTSWTLAFASMNDTGNPPCCPYPAVLVAAVILQVRDTVEHLVST
jgi:hypothetical protein